METIKIEHLRKEFKNVVAVSDLTLEINKGEIFGLLGVNGAGKTTTIKMLSGLIKPTSGSAKIFGKDLKEDLNEIKQIISISPQESAIAKNLTVYENLLLMAELYGQSKKEAEENVKEVSHALSLDNYLKRRAKTLSGGYKRRLSIAMALVLKPQILFLDEPTLGLDVINRHELWKIIADLKGKITIILTSHYMEEIAALTDHIAIMKDGNLLKVGTLEEILKETNKENLEEAFIKIVEDK